jgi:hypothetical protein
LLATSGIITNSAQINNAVITNAKIENAAVDTLKIAGNADTVPTSSTSGTTLAITFIFQDTLTVTLDGADFPVVLLFSAIIEQLGSNNMPYEYRIYNNTTSSILYGPIQLAGNNTQFTTFSGVVQYTPTSDNEVIALQIREAGENDNWPYAVHTRTLTALTVKR